MSFRRKPDAALDGDMMGERGCDTAYVWIQEASELVDAHSISTIGTMTSRRGLSVALAIVACCLIGCDRVQQYDLIGYGEQLYGSPIPADPGLPFCHKVKKTGQYRRLRLRQRALGWHREHGDGMPPMISGYLGESVRDVRGHRFDFDCEPVAPDDCPCLTDESVELTDSLTRWIEVSVPSTNRLETYLVSEDEAIGFRIFLDTERMVGWCFDIVAGDQQQTANLACPQVRACRSIMQKRATELDLVCQDLVGTGACETNVTCPSDTSK